MTTTTTRTTNPHTALIQAFLAKEQEEQEERLRYIRKVLLTHKADPEKRKNFIIDLRECLEDADYEDIAEYEQYKKNPAVNTWFCERGLVIEEKYGVIAKEFGYANAREMFDL